MHTLYDNDYELAVRLAKYLEKLLEDQFGAHGNGLHEKITSVEHQLPDATVRRLRYIAAVRNKLVHDDNYARLHDRQGFINACIAAESALHKQAAPATSRHVASSQRQPSGSDGWAAAILGIGGLAVVGGALLVKYLRDEGYI